MRWRGGERPRRNWMSCAACWMSTKGERDDELRALDIAGADADARLDPAAFHLARGGAGSDDGFSGDYIRVVAARNHSGRAVRGARFFAVGWDGGATSSRRRSLRR